MFVLTMSIAAHGALRGPSQPVRLLGSQSQLATTVILTPTDTSHIQTLTGPTIFDVTVERDKNRSHLTLNVSQSFRWRQIPNNVPYHFVAAFRLFISSDQLPAPGSFEALAILAQSEEHADTSPGSQEDITRSSGFQRQVTLDRNAMEINLQIAYPALSSPSERTALARRLIESAVRFTIQPSVTVRSVERVIFDRCDRCRYLEADAHRRVGLPHA